MVCISFNDGNVHWALSYPLWRGGGGELYCMFCLEICGSKAMF